MKTRMTTTYMTLVALVLAPSMWAVSPPPDGGYPGGNTAEGQSALLGLNTGGYNTALGWFSLESLTTGSFNTGVGAGTLVLNSGDENTATGAGALLSNTTGQGNTANGAFALVSNTSGGANTATGDHALISNIGFANTADGAFALRNNTEGIQNTAEGYLALSHNTTGNQNTAIGVGALSSTTGSYNIAIGYFAGISVTTASDVTCINHSGADVSNSTWISNVYGVTTQSGTVAPVVVSDDGQLGTVASAERFKKDIATMENASEAILLLRPVTFHYKTDANGTLQFGLIAEEVAKVNPALVLPDHEGKPYTVRYDAVNAMLLNEFLKEHRKVDELEKQVAALNAGLQKVSAQVELSKCPTRTVVDK